MKMESDSLQQIISESRTAWNNECNYSEILDAHLINIFNNFEDVKINWKIDILMDKIHSNQDNEIACIRSGSCAEGVQLPGSDVDIMYWRNHHMIVQDHPSIHPSYPDVTNVLLLHRNAQQPGFALLECRWERFTTIDIRTNLVNFDNSRILSSDNFKKFHIGIHSPQDSLNGPSIRNLSSLGSETDSVYCLRCGLWPDDAYEYITRDRKHGWPSPEIIQHIYDEGIHLVPIGSREKNLDGSWSHNPLEWRYSFSYAETELIHSLNAVQFRMYGLLKIILNDILKPRIPEGCMCSYYMKTIILWTVEETPGEIWTPRNLIPLLEHCIRRLISCVINGMCPNYFLPSQNIYYGKIYDTVQTRLLAVLTDLYRRGWRFILESNTLAYVRQNIEKARTIMTPIPGTGVLVTQSTLGLQTNAPSQLEYGRDLKFFCTMRSIQAKLPNQQVFEERLQIAKDLYNNEKYDNITADVAKTQYHLLSCDVGIALFHRVFSRTGNTANKKIKKQIYKCLNYILQSIPGDISKGNLTLATVYYLLGNPSKALSFINAFKSKNGCHVIYIPRKVDRQYIINEYEECYIQRMCGRNLSRQEKASEAMSYGFEAFRSVPVVPFDLLFELMMVDDSSYILSINPLPYASYLAFLCCTELDHKEKAEANFQDLLWSSIADNVDTYMTSLMTGNCYRMLDQYESALQYYIRAFRGKKRIADTYEFSGENKARQSPLVYIALLLNLII